MALIESTLVRCVFNLQELFLVHTIASFEHSFYVSMPPSFRSELQDTSHMTWPTLPDDLTCYLSYM